MSADFKEQSDAIRAWFSAGSGLSLIVYENEQRPFVKKQWGTIKISSAVREGTDVLRYRMIGDDNTPEVVAVRLVTLVLGAESISQAGGSLALEPLTLLTAASLLPEQAKILKAASLAYVDDTEIVNADRAIDEHWVSRFELTLRLRWGFVISRNTLADNIGTIEHVTGEGKAPGDLLQGYAASRP